MRKSNVLNVVLGVFFVLLLLALVASGAISGMERDNNIYGSPADQLFPWLAIAVLGVGAVWGVSLFRSLSRRRR